MQISFGKRAIATMVALGAVTALAGCDPQVPDSGSGVGFSSYTEYQQRQAQNAGLVPTGVVSDETTGLPAAPVMTNATLPPAGQVAASSGSAEEIAAETRAALSAAEANSGVAPVNASPSNPAPPVVNVAGISNENNFEAVGEVRSIQDDANRIAANRAQYEQVQPTALPGRVGTGPNIVEYALKSRHPIGQKLFTRSPLNGQSKFVRNCAKYPSPDLAQEDFLAAGGPARDRMGLDPDGDGFACQWDPRPFQLATGG
ncbi:hypothetical protein A9Q95_10050 [Rhodobacterales bacterium 59_46_T64]|nr:hypothetical protein A9Q95_10050 [Rhodobacterales bacterium 59_46_T64]